MQNTTQKQEQESILNLLEPNVEDWLKSVARVREESVEEFAAAILNEHVKRCLEILAR